MSRILVTKSSLPDFEEYVEEKVKFNELESRERSIKKHFSLKSFV